MSDYFYTSKMPEEKKNDYTLTLEGAAQIIGRSERTVQRYVRAGELSQIYVMGPKGKEARLSKSELVSLAKKMASGLGSALGGGAGRPRATKTGTEQVNLNIMDLLQRHEQIIYRLGQLEAKTENVAFLEERARSLTEHNKELVERDAQQRQQVAALEHKIERLERELKRPLTMAERLSGQRQKT